jgi:hypothetical protein
MAKSLWLLVLALLAQADLYGQTTAPVSPEKQFAGDILRHQDRAMNVLLGWSGLSVASGAVMLSSGSPVTRDFGLQNIGWGAIDGGIALFAKHGIAKKRKTGFDPEKERKNFQKILLINSLLDVVYVGAGSALVASGKDKLKGHGYGVIVQGSFLFLFDGINYLLVKRKS